MLMREYFLYSHKYKSKLFKHIQKTHTINNQKINDKKVIFSYWDFFIYVY